MIIMYMLGWWYGFGWAWAVKGFADRLQAINEMFSVATLLKTLFAPWKQIQSTSSFQNFLQSSLDNFISRLIGATVRLGMLIGAAISILLVSVLGIIASLLWPMVPLLVLILPVASFMVFG